MRRPSRQPETASAIVAPARALASMRRLASPLPWLATAFSLTLTLGASLSSPPAHADPATGYTNKVFTTWSDPEDPEYHRSLWLEQFDRRARRLWLQECIMSVRDGEECKYRTLDPDAATQAFTDVKIEGSRAWQSWTRVQDGIVYRRPINLDRGWPGNVMTWTRAPGQTLDPDRKVLELYTPPPERVRFTSFYYEPTRVGTGPLKVAILFKLGQAAWLASVENSFYDRPTIEALRDEGYLVLLANHRGQAMLDRRFRLQGPAHLHDRAILDVLGALNALARVYPSIDKKNLRVLGHGFGGMMAALLATRLGDYASDWQISRTLVSNGVFNPVEGFYGFFEGFNRDPRHPDDITEDRPLDFSLEDWVHGGLCTRPVPTADAPYASLTDAQWLAVQRLEHSRMVRLGSSFLQGPITECRPQAWLDMSPYHNISKLQGQMLALVSADETGMTAPQGARQFALKAGGTRVRVELHALGHTFDTDAGVGFWLKRVREFFRE